MFTNTVGPFHHRRTSAVTAMMELWEACFFVLILDLTFGKDISSNARYVVRTIESCPAVGYFFKREPAPNLVDSGPCYLCFCKENGTATCWERERRRCDVERYHHHRVGRQSRFRRSFSDVFFKDATRDFFGKNLPQQCKPFESSFSDGCPPADWCVGCTICDCDSNGRWDCHILSFCDGKESKKKIKSVKHHRSKKAKKSLDYDNSIEVKPTKKAPMRITSKKTTTKPKTTKPPKKNVRKVVKAKPGNKTNTRTKKGPKRSTTKKQASKKVTNRAQTKAMSQNHPRSNVSKGKIIKKIAVTRKPVRLNRNAVKGLKLNPNNSDTVKLGQKIVQQVMTTFKKILAKEIEKLNETKRTKVMDGKDCGGVKKRDKRTYNVRSKAIARNKNKYNRPGILRENYTSARIKRQILDQEQANKEKKTVITLPTDISAVIPLSTVKKEVKKKNSSTKKILDNMTPVPFFTTQRDNYYKYSIKNESNWTSATEPTKNITENKESDLENNLVIPTKSNNEMSELIKYNDTKTINPDFNDLKFTKWYIIKIKNDERKKQVTRSLLPKLSTTKSFEYGKTTNKEYYTSKLQKKKMEPNNDVTKKYNFTTFAPTVYTKPCCTKYPKNTHNVTDVTGLKKIIQNLFTELNKTNSVQRKQKSKVSVLKYVRKIFHKIFSKKKSKSHKIYGLGTKEDHTLQILCENIGPCKIKRNNRMILQYKLKQLNNEIKTVLKSISTVKGLLHLLDLPNSDKTIYMAKKSSFQSDILKLGAVLKDYNDDEMNSSLTFTQKTQIDYIKKNTQTFIDSVKKFADILTDILAMIKPNVKYDQSLKSLHKKQDYTASLNKIKKILYQYNIMQNTFMRKMYELINGNQKKTTTTEQPQILDSDRNRNSSDVIEKYSKNIIENLKRLKSIAHVLSAKRKKRELRMRDDALDYLLTLMEMLIKQNHPLSTIPANDDDGIDLLIDAIKNAPDIKPMKNKDLYYTPINPHSKLGSIAETGDLQTSDINSDSKRITDEENSTDSDDNIIGQDNVIKDVSSKPEALTFRDIDDDVTQKVYYRIFNQQNNNDYEGTTEYNSITKKRSNDEPEKTGFDKFESYLGDPKKLEIETSYLEDDATGDMTTDNTPGTTNKTNNTYRNIEDHTVFSRKVTEKTTAYIVTSNESNSESQDSMNGKRSKLEWIEETFDREIRLINNTSFSLPQRTSTQSTQPAPISTAMYIENNSDLTKEEHTEQGVKRTPKNVKQHDVLYEKHVQFLNSLDYGTEKSADFEEADSKDDARSDDVFPAYFV